MTHYDWELIRNEYVMSLPAISKAALADKYHVARQNVSIRAKKEDWDMRREVYIKRVDEQRQETKATLLADTGASFDTDLLRLAQDVVTKVQGLMNSEMTSNIRFLKELAATAKIAQDVGKTALGDNPKNDMTISLTDQLRNFLGAK